jgi:hypothetical protein
VCSKNKSSATVITEGFIETASFPVPLFFRPSFVYRKGKANIHSFQLEEFHTGAKAIAHFFIDHSHHAWSLPASPFGSVYVNASCQSDLLCHFIKEIKVSLIKKNVQSITVKHFPACYNQHVHDITLHALLASDFNVTCTELNQYLPLHTLSKKETFDQSKLHLIKKCKEAGFHVTISSTCNAEEWFDIIVRARRLRGHPMTIDLQGLRSLTDGNAECYHFFEVKNEDKIISCAIGVQVSEDVMYYYLAADEDAYRSYSPMTFLLDSMYDFACEKNMKILDMGISSSQGIVNEGLRWFKKSFGSLEEPKFTLKWNASSEQTLG